MPPRLAERLNSERQRRFVGRTAEIDLLRAAVTADELPFCVLFIHGPGGIGKTTLMREFVRLCTELVIPAHYVDGRITEPSAAAFLETLRQGMQLPPGAEPVEQLAAAEQRRVLLIDNYEALTTLDGWLRDELLPELSAEVLVVLAGREQPALAWRTDPGWQELLRVIQLRNLSHEESLGYLNGRNVPDEQHTAVLGFTHGHPLALALVADTFAQRGGFAFRPEAAPDVIKNLIEQLVQKVPGPAHRAALEACALVRLMSEALLAVMLMNNEVHEIFAWLRGLSFIEASDQGLFPHDLVREALDADVRWRNPAWYAELHRRARGYYAEQLPHLTGVQQQHLLTDYVFLHRHNPVVRPVFSWQEASNLLPDTVRPGDRDTLLAMVERHEGEESAHMLEYWLNRQPEGLLLLRSSEGRPAGMLLMLALERATPEELAFDPGAAAAWACLQQHAPLRSGERATLFRFWMAGESYQAISPVQSMVFINAVRHYLTTPGLAFSFFPCAEPERWAAVFAYADLERLPGADFSVGGRRYGVYGHDWRRVPPAAWLDLLAERELATGPLPDAPPAPALEVLDEAHFAEAVRDALRDLTRSDRLAASPLLRARLVAARAGASAGSGERIAALQALLREVCQELQNSPRDLKLYRALHHTYLQPAATQEQAAELLDLPFSTFRRHLKEGIARVTMRLWQAEIEGGV